MGNSKEMTWIIAKIKELINKRFYGKLIISFQAGNIVHAEIRETIKPD